MAKFSYFAKSEFNIWMKLKVCWRKDLGATEAKLPGAEGDWEESTEEGLNWMRAAVTSFKCEGKLT